MHRRFPTANANSEGLGDEAKIDGVRPYSSRTSYCATWIFFTDLEPFGLAAATCASSSAEKKRASGALLPPPTAMFNAI